MENSSNFLAEYLGIMVFRSQWCRTTRFKIRTVVTTVTTKSQSEVVEQWVPCSNSYSIKDLQDMQKENSDIGPIVKWFSSGSRPETSIAASASPATRHYLGCTGFE